MSVVTDRTASPGFYAQQSPFSDPGSYAALFDALSSGVPAGARVVQGLLMHPAAAKLYGQPPEPEGSGWGYRTVTETLERLLALDDAPLTVIRPPARRLRANCRNFAVLFVAILRHQGVPARKRVGFATYLPGSHASTHEIAEYWDEAASRWVLVDPQNDDVSRAAQRAYFGRIGEPERGRYDTLDIEAGTAFALAGTIWRACRRGEVDPSDFRCGPHRGMPEIRLTVLQELDSLNRVELLSNDAWHELMTKPDAELTDGELALLDRMAELTTSVDERFEELRGLYEGMAYARAVRTELQTLGLR